MSRTWKDRPYRVMAMEAVDRGWYSIGSSWARWAPETGVWSRTDGTRSLGVIPEVVAWGYGAGPDVHVPSDRLRMYRWLEEDWTPDHGTRRAVRDGLRDAVRTANTYGPSSDEMADWDDPEAMRRRIRWSCGN